ncbi:unnamed protein product [Caenorhabditis angaria]|uniref:Uncharacterized protein n=1 Tax=Caenorhabditis angaria TaxID=860376 RepID=A0A9P1J5H5_9PELO|nr:unnamed protein product [Caenorhabditis angaria]
MTMRILFLCLFVFTLANACYDYRHGRMFVSMLDEDIEKYNLKENGVNIFMEEYSCTAELEKEYIYDPVKRIYIVRKQMCPNNCDCKSFVDKTYQHPKFIEDHDGKKMNSRTREFIFDNNLMR